MKKNGIYQFTCQICHKDGKKVYYFGETASANFERMEEHRRMIINRNEESPMIEHQNAEHPEEAPDFTAKILKCVQKPLERQCREGYLIGNPPDDITLMNRKGEWGQNLPPKFTYEAESQNDQNGQNGQKKRILGHEPCLECHKQ